MTIPIKLTLSTAALIISGTLLEIVILFREMQQLQTEVQDGMADFDAFSNGAWSLMFSGGGGKFFGF
jgi:hypothetical protein